MRLRFWICAWVVLFAQCVFAINASGHEVRPAFLKITESEPGVFSVLWKQPVIEDRRLKIIPTFPEGCDRSSSQQSRNAGTVSESFTVTCALQSGMLTLKGLEHTLTDAFVEITYQDGDTKRSLLKPSDPRLNLSAPVPSAATAYLKIGVEHILFGWDHLLFVIGLTLLVARRQIWMIATAFTLAHSITLVLAALGVLTVPTRPVEILIAASIVLLAVEIIRKFRGHDSLATRRPYLISFLIGLIHGCGFASALSDIGLPQGTELLALLLFNLGVEMGQFGVIAVFLIILAGLAKVGSETLRRAQLLTTYIIGTIAMYWVIDRLAQYWV